MRTLLLACTLCLAAGVGADAVPPAPSVAHARELIRVKEYDQAKTELSAAIERLQGADLDAALLALAGLETRPEAARALYERVAGSSNADAAHGAELELAKILYASGEYDRALEMLLSNDKRPAPADPTSCYLRGLCYRQLGEAARAREEFIKVDRDEYLSWSLIALADIDREEGRVAQAVERYAAIGGSFASPIASFKLGECYELLGDRSKAIDAYRAIVSDFPRTFEASQAKEKLARLAQAKPERREAPAPKGGEGGTAVAQGAQTNEAPRPMYTIQFGAFSSQSAAERLAKRVSSIIPEARVENVDTGERTLYRVRAGKYAKRDDAEEDAARAREKLAMPCTIVPLR
jgi:tetratricopeptide (TPR) repeat protein